MSRLTLDEAHTLHKLVLDTALQIMIPKRVDYSGQDDPFANFRWSLLWDVPPWKGAAVRMTDKLSRFKQLSEKAGKGEVKDESIIDTIADAVNYDIIMLLLWAEENAPQVIEQLKAMAREQMTTDQVKGVIGPATERPPLEIAED